MNNLKYLSKRFRIESYPLSTLKRWHSTEMMLNTVSDQDGRLRSEEENYSTKVSSPIEEPYGSVLKSLAERTAKELPNGHMMVSELQGRLLHQLVKLLRPRHVLEIGGFTGYSAIAMGSGLGHDAKLLSLELENKHIKIAQKHVEMAKLQDKIQFREGPASDSVVALVNQLPGLKYDFIFLDADKGGYIDYYEQILEYDLLSTHGLLCVDNVLFFGQVHKTNSQASNNIKKTAAKIRAFNEHVIKDSRTEVIVLPLFDGISFIRKK